MSNKLVLGTVQFGLNYGVNNNEGKPTQKVINEILSYAFENNITILDTAEAYGDAQHRIGSYHKTSPYKFNIITKFSSGINDLSNAIIKRVEDNLITLNVDKLYAYMFHSYDDFKKYFKGFKKDLQQLKRENKIENIGVSVYTNEQLLDVLNFSDITLVQLPFNLLDNESKRGDILKLAKQKGVEIHTRSAFLQGLFFKPLKEFPMKLNSLIPYLKKINHIKKDLSVSTESLSLKYPLQKEYIDKVIIGVGSIEQLKSNLKITNQSTDISLKKIDDINVAEKELLNPANWNL
jgi:aryl-alcohol dehydrogenase-like predicted oxidoreductase